MMGDAQGREEIANVVGNLAFDVGKSQPQVGAIVGNYVGGFIVQAVNINYGTYWVFGIILALFGFILVARGDRKPRDPSEREPLLKEPLK
jgi:predicted MFS family arabinose efflux permease